ncbi:MAG: TerC family protein [Anaerolineae bacterium]|nr:TerC family protein [Anaerolineae bacterium]
MDWLNPEMLIAMVTLIALELVLGVDNVIFISILAGKLPQAQQARARTVGISLAVITRILLLLSLSFIVGLTAPIVSVAGFTLSGRDIVLVVGGLFLIVKSVQEIHQKLEGEEGHISNKVPASFQGVIIQILLLDIVFSLDSVITAVGMVNEIPIMVIAVIVSAGVMIVASGPISAFVEKHPTVKMLALSFLLLIGFTLVVEALHVHIPKGYIYFAMGFSVMVELLNLRIRGTHPVKLHEEVVREASPSGAAPVKPA